MTTGPTFFMNTSFVEGLLRKSMTNVNARVSQEPTFKLAVKTYFFFAGLNLNTIVQEKTPEKCTRCG